MVNASNKRPFLRMHTSFGRGWLVAGARCAVSGDVFLGTPNDASFLKLPSIPLGMGAAATEEHKAL